MEGKAPLRILGETAYPLITPGARVRMANFVPFLRDHGVALDYHAMLTNEEYRILSSTSWAGRKATILAASASRALRGQSDHDLFLVYRLRLLTPMPGVDPPRRLDAYDIDDALFVGAAAAVNQRFQWAKREAQRCTACLRRARVVIAGNSFLASKAREHARRVEVIPSCVDPTIQRLHSHEAAPIVTVGWIGSQTTSAYLEPVLSVFARINRDTVRARLVVIGGRIATEASWIDQRPWSLAAEADEISAFDIGIMPLPDTEWTRGKCGYKILQYFAAGVPAIASPVGVTSELIGDDRGLLASASHEWQAALERLIEDVEERRERGANARAFVERSYSYQRWAPDLAALFHSLAE